jgi:UDP-glucose 4-epimerase
MRILLTGATGKLGQTLLPALQKLVATWQAEIVALCNRRTLQGASDIRIVHGTLADPGVVRQAMAGVTHVIHMAAVKETPELAFDVALKGMYLLLEEARANPEFSQFILIGGDCSVGHMFQNYHAPITEASPRRAYPGVYALTKVLEEVMLEQAQHQYGLNGCILRAPWIMEKDDFRFAMRFGSDQFGGPAWSDLLPAETLAALNPDQHVPLMRDHTGAALKRNFIHVSDLVNAILAALDNPAAHQRLFNISMDEPVDYARVAKISARLQGLIPVEVPTPFYSNWLDNSAARQALGWRPAIGLEAMIEASWSYTRAPEDPRKIWYPG